LGGRARSSRPRTARRRRARMAKSGRWTRGATSTAVGPAYLVACSGFAMELVLYADDCALLPLPCPMIPSSYNTCRLSVPLLLSRISIRRSRHGRNVSTCPDTLLPPFPFLATNPSSILRADPDSPQPDQVHRRQARPACARPEPHRERRCRCPRDD
jgi:hypothetical protein